MTEPRRNLRAMSAEMLLRIDQVRRMLLTGCAYMDIVRFTAAKWGASQRSTDTYIARATAEIRAAVAIDRDANIAEAIAARRELRRKADHANDHRLALQILQDEAKLLDLYPAERQQHSGEMRLIHSVDLRALSDEELDQLERLATKANAGPGGDPSRARQTEPDLGASSGAAI